MTTEQILNDRAQRLLKALVEYYIREGQPVGSTTLARETNLELSSATIRNVIADLERLGLVRSPHTSSGRIPTVQGYRLFIDNLLTIKPLENNVVNLLTNELNAETNTKSLVEATSSMLSELTKMAGVVTIPAREQSRLVQIEFLKLSDRRLLAILVFSDKEVQNRIIYPTQKYSQSELQSIANYLNAEFLGKDISAVREKILREMKDAKDKMNDLMLNAISMGQQVFSQEVSSNSDYVIAGETNLMSYEDMADIKRLRQLFEAFNEKRSILNILDHSLTAPGVQIYVGNESGYDAFDDCSVITAHYTDGDNIIGALGVIGPTRMAYDKVIPIVDVTARLLGAVIKQRQ